MKALTNRRVKPGFNPIHTLSEMADDARDLQANGTDISDEIVCLIPPSLAGRVRRLSADY